MFVREQCNAAFGRSRLGDHPIRPSAHFLRRLAARTSVLEYQPARRPLVDLPGRQTLACAIVLLDEVGFDDGRIAETG